MSGKRSGPAVRKEEYKTTSVTANGRRYGSTQQQRQRTELLRSREFFSLAKEKKYLGGAFEARTKKEEKTSRARETAEINME